MGSGSGCTAYSTLVEASVNTTDSGYSVCELLLVMSCWLGRPWISHLPLCMHLVGVQASVESMSCLKPAACEEPGSIEFVLWGYTVTVFVRQTARGL